MIDRVRAWLRSILLHRRLELERREEMESHLERATERFVRRGLSEAEARRAALREFGNVDRLREQGRRAHGSIWIDEVRGDLRFALRHWARMPLSAAVVVLLLVLGIGANTAFFTIVHSDLTRPPPGVAADEDLVRIRGIQAFGTQSRQTTRAMSYPEVEAYRARTGLFREVATWSSGEVVLDLGGERTEAIPALAHVVDEGYFQLLGIAPVIGRTPEPSAGGPPSVVIDHGLWMQAFGGDVSALGRTVELNQHRVVIAGVAPPRFRGVNAGASRPTVWLALDALPVVIPTVSRTSAADPDAAHFHAIARLAPEVAPEEAASAVAEIAARWVEARTDPPTGGTADVVPFRGTNAHPAGPDVAELSVMAILSLLVLLAACTNVAGLLVGLAARREREVGVRMALGASRGRLARLFLTESLLLAGVAGGLSLAVVALVTRVFGDHLSDVDVVVDRPAILTTLAVALVAGLVAGLIPALGATRKGLRGAMARAHGSGAPTESRLQDGLVVTQVALTLPLVTVVAVLGLLLGAQWRGAHVPERYENIVSLRFAIAGGLTFAERTAAITEAGDALAAVPGVEQVVPQPRGFRIQFLAVHPEDRVSGTPTDPLRIRFDPAPEGHFDLLGIPFVRGRDFLPHERDSTSLAIVVADDLARELWGDADPLGRRLIHVAGPRSEAVELAGVVVGVVDGDSGAGRGQDGNVQRVLVPHLAFPGGFLVRTRGRSVTRLPALRAAVAAATPTLALDHVETLAEAERSRRSELQAAAAAVAGLAILALFLSSVGLYALVAFAIARRTHEIGVRRALGAGPGSVVRRFFLRGMIRSGLGIVLGIVPSVLGLQLIASQIGFPEQSVILVATTTGVAVLVITGLASWLPSRRAARVAPTVALREE